MHLLITGAGGFIGRHLCEHFAPHCNVTGISLRKESPDSIAMEEIGTVIHLAGIVHQPNADNESYTRINYEQTVRMAELAKKAGVKQFVFFSTMAVYGQHGSLDDQTPLTEQSPCQPDTPYGQTKYDAELALLALEDETFRVAIVRPPMVYGPHCPGNMPRLRRLVEKAPLLPLGWTKNLRALVSIDNLTRFVEAIVFQQQQGIFLPQDPEPLSIKQICQQLSHSSHRKVWLMPIPTLLLRLAWRIKPSICASLYGTLYYDNRQSCQQLAIDGLESSAQGIDKMCAVPPKTVQS